MSKETSENPNAEQATATSAKTPASSRSRNLQAMGMSRAPSSENQEIFMLPRQKSRSRERRESRLFLVDGQLCWDDPQSPGAGYSGVKRGSSIGMMFGSSMDLSGIGQSIDSSGGAGSGSEEAISYRIKWCRENILQLKRQTWPMEKKLQVLKASKLFIKQHQGELKQSKQAKDVIASTSAIFERYWRHFKREFANFLVIITPWEMRIKKIESHFGSVVASYFTFLRWIFWLNLANSLVMCSFVMVPELIENVPDLTGMRKGELGMQQQLGSDGKPQTEPEFNPTLGEMWEFEGFLKFSPIFYGYYSNVEISRSGFWRNPLAFLMSAMLTYLFCFFCISRKLSQNTKLSRIGSKDDEYTFCWTVFVGWDFMIGNSETAYNKTSSLVMNLKEGILEEKEQTKDRDWRLIIRRVFANLLTIMLIVASAYVVTLAVQRSENLPEDASLLQKNELQLVMSGIQFMFPPLFDVIGIIEKYHPRKALSWQLGRILFLDFLNFYTLMFSLFGTVDQMGLQLNEISGNVTLLRKNATYYSSLFTTTTTTTTTTTSTSTTLAPETSTILPMDSPVNGTLAPQIAAGGDATNSTGGLNASTIMTTILLASSTMMPSDGQATNSLTTTSSLSPVPSPGSTPSILSTTIASATTSTTIASTLQLTVLSSLATTTTTTTAATTSSTTSRQPSSSRAPEEEDYPDLGEVLKVAATPKRRRKRATVGSNPRKSASFRQIGKTRANAALKSIERELGDDPSIEDIEVVGDDRDSNAHESEELTRRSQPSQPPQQQQKPARQQVPARIHGNFLPPIRDPYKTLGNHWPQPSTGEPKSDSRFYGPEDELEEPLEGRLEQWPTSTTPTTTTSRRPRPGIARPIGGSSKQRPRARGGRVQLTTVAPSSLDDDTNEDIENPPSAIEAMIPVASGSSQFVEPTTSIPTLVSMTAEPEFQVGGASTAGAGYSIVSTANTQPQLESELIGGLQPGSATPAASGSASDSGDQPQAKSGLAPNFAGASEQTEGDNPNLGVDSSSASCTPMASSTTESSIGGANLKKSSVGFNASEVSYSDCIEIPEFKHQEILALNSTFKDKLKNLCWETMFGQEMVKIVVMDLVMTVVSAVSFEFMRACFVRYCNRFFFWDLERGFPGYQDFKIAENVLHLVNNQSTVWMGMFFAPGLPAINTVKLAVLMYVRSWAVLTCNIPHETVFKVSKSNNFYYWILLINLLICILPVAYAVTWIRPSWHCGPFGGECRMYLVVTKLVKSMLPPEANSVFRYLTSPGAVIPILISLILIIYYLASTVSSSKEANKELKAQLKKDKEQEAAVPEITSTTVVDAAPAATGPVAGPAAGAAPAPVAPPAAATPSLAAAANPNSLAPASQQQQQAESRPKSLLMPPVV